MGQKIKIKIRKFWRKKQTRGIPTEQGSAWKDIAVRAVKTFVQTFLASLPVDAAMLASGWSVWRAALLSATAAGISAVMNFIIAALDSKEGGDDPNIQV